MCVWRTVRAIYDVIALVTESVPHTLLYIRRYIRDSLNVFPSFQSEGHTDVFRTVRTEHWPDRLGCVDSLESEEKSAILGIHNEPLFGAHVNQETNRCTQSSSRRRVFRQWVVIQPDAIVKRHQADCAAQRTPTRADCPRVRRPVYGIILVDFWLSSNGDLQETEWILSKKCFEDNGFSACMVELLILYM